MLASLTDVLRKAQRGHYAVGAEILSALDQAYRLHWLTTEARMRPDVSAEGIEGTKYVFGKKPQPEPAKPAANVARSKLPRRPFPIRCSTMCR